MCQRPYSILSTTLLKIFLYLNNYGHYNKQLVRYTVVVCIRKMNVFLISIYFSDISGRFPTNLCIWGVAYESY